ncbi:MAG: YcxB family protein [Acidobacteriota bacterium]
MNISYEGRPTRSELEILSSVGLRAAIPSGTPIQRIFLIVGALASVAALVSMRVPSGQPFSWFIIATPCLAIWALIIRAQRKALAAAPLELRAGEITEEGFTIRMPGSESNMSWSRITDAAVDPAAIVLLVRPATYFAFPRSFFGTETDWQVFSRFVSARFPVPPPRTGAKPFPALQRGLPRWLIIAAVTVAAAFFAIVVYLGSA